MVNTISPRWGNTGQCFLCDATLHRSCQKGMAARGRSSIVLKDELQAHHFPSLIFLECLKSSGQAR
jgi:hypothetical protein